MSLQLAVVLVYFAFVSVVGVVAARMSRSVEDFLVAGRNLGLPMCAVSIAGEWVGGTSTIGTAESGYMFGVSAGWYVVANAIGTVVLAYTLARLYRRSECYTVPQLLERYYGVGCRVASSIVLTFVMIVVGSVQIVAGAALIQTLTGMEPRQAMIVTGLVFLAYTLAGGLWAIGYTNLLHVAVTYVGVLAGLVLVARDAGGLATLVDELPAYPYFSLVGAGAAKVTAWIIASVLAATVAQAAIQPIMGARDEHTAQRAALVAAVLIAPIGIATAFLGMFAKVLLPGIEPRAALPELLVRLSPVAGGVVLAGICGAILSTVAPCILAAGTLLAKDIYQRVINPGASELQVYRAARLLTLFSGLIAIVMAMYSTVILDQIYFAYTLRAAIAVLVLMSVYTSGIPSWAAMWSLVLTTVASVAWEVLKSHSGGYPVGLHPMYLALAITLAVIWVGKQLRVWSDRYT